jgi:hypothetical protein
MRKRCFGRLFAYQEKTIKKQWRIGLGHIVGDMFGESEEETVEEKRWTDPGKRVFAYKKKGDEGTVIRRHEWDEKEPEMHITEEDWNEWIKDMQRRQREQDQQRERAKPIIIPEMEVAKMSALKSFSQITVWLYQGNKRVECTTLKTKYLAGETDILESARYIFRKKGAKWREDMANREEGLFAVE